MSMTVSLFLVALAVGWMIYLSIEAGAVRRAFSAWARGTLANLGIPLEGDPLVAYTLKGSVHGVELKAENKSSRAAPGAREDENRKTVGVIELPLALPDLIVCRTADVDRVMGPLPAVPRTLTGHDDFDRIYSLFVSNTTAGPDVSGAGYRQSGATGALGWAKPPILDRLIELELEWMRVRAGACELAFQPLLPGDMVRAVVTSANLSRSLTGAALVPVREADSPLKIDVEGATKSPLPGPLMGGFWGGILGAAVLAASDLPTLETILSFSAGLSMICSAFVARTLFRRGKCVPKPTLPADASDRTP